MGNGTWLPECLGAQVPVKLGWNVQLLENLLSGYHDREVVQWIKYGWPVSRPLNWRDPTPSFENHASAEQFLEDVENYIAKELDRKATMGPFSTVPFTSWIGVSPLSTRTKKDCGER